MGRKVKVETPGTPAAPTSEAESSQSAAQSTPDAAPPSVTPETPPATDPTIPPNVPGGPPDTPEVLKAKEQQLAREVADVQKNLVGSDKALDWSHLTQPVAIVRQINHLNGDDNLPSADEIDPATIPFGQRVLTKSGWIVSTQTDPRIRR
jgi:hypothetical protein